MKNHTVFFFFFFLVHIFYIFHIEGIYINKNSLTNDKNILICDNTINGKSIKINKKKKTTDILPSHMEHRIKNKSKTFFIDGGKNMHVFSKKKRNVHNSNVNDGRNSNVLYAENYKINLTEKPLIEDVPRNVKGRLNEWINEFDENNTLGFFPILLEEMSNEPSPLQVGFEDYMQFNGEHVEEIFKNMTREVVINGEKKKIFGMCFFNHKTGVLAPLAIYAEIKDVTKVGNNLAVKGLVRGRVIIDEIISQEPCILGKISPIEDKKGLVEPEESLKIIDEIIRIHTQCSNMESQLMEQLDQSFASMNIKLRNDLKESIDAKLEKFQIDPSDVEQRQAFIQMASFAAFDFHLMIVDRYDALMLQNSEDRLRFVRDKIRQKQKQLAIIKNTPKDKLHEILQQVQNLKNQNMQSPNYPKNAS
ncbi:hypothetical protein PFAG_04487 [Plasmodium falciparum Santa Lucia]|uniref:Uncharacterized protein n=14 Tax=Plasmodium falciparum TaxID=5833 RepID=Q8IE81_PLAF7|nr:conserved protein, unknown function [Plasmodium falciparum 3D7]ETW16983.1 hypothetical protein PFFVO_04088 [Plasmodium falciparum Vietnam Oak-Knoll (FVO)]ETW29567.1 hypothetical protein PFFCH_03040 [Plasmodium falciparum FCH/4]ETW41016.1 hypothetical protein PFNF135_04651 [Plasmodium falciparum NF135/5.C10]ETW47652.1 hypothetical protein PFMALIP_04343 [Plasmodium falciparum MaliPS096_E11]EUR66234.1 hypothetical protein PFBG_04522 [Plasmodium falciparum 7G8]EUT81273.1 hypothetical protein P|eukprot:XP_001349976.1 conserved Plasmodium protein, unknown function [Plasmodium falciparum 3D7]